MKNLKLWEENMRLKEAIRAKDMEIEYLYRRFGLLK